MADTKKYNYMERVLQEVNSNFISLPDKDVKRNNQILESVLSTFIDKMKNKDPLFKVMFRRVFYGGSYYDGLRVGKPEEFDLDLLLSLPKYSEPVLTTSNMPGFVHLQVKNYDAFMKQPEAGSYKNFRNLFDEKFFLHTTKVLAWMEGLVQKTVNDFPQSNGKRILTNSNGTFEVLFVKGGPALTLKISGSGVKMDVDLVTCFVFGADKWPQSGFKPNPVSSKPEFFIVPKPLKNSSNGHTHRYWRLSFQEQERVLMDNKRTLKPTIKLLKKLRDNLNHKAVASYYIKTAVLQISESKNPDFWKNSLSYVFMTVLKEYLQFFEKGKIPYFWNKNNNLLGGVSSSTVQNMTNKLKAVVNDIERKPTEPLVVAQHLLNNQEYATIALAQMSLK